MGIQVSRDKLKAIAAELASVIESLNSVIRRVSKRCKLFLNGDSALKVVFLVIQQAAKKWIILNHDWKPAMNRFIIEFGDRMDGHL